MEKHVNTLFYGDCLDVLKTLPDESVDLIYLDPPFNSKKDYNAFFTSSDGKQSPAQVMAFEDTWHWVEQTQKEYNDILHSSGGGPPKYLKHYCQLFTNF